MWSMAFLGGARYQQTILDQHPNGWGFTIIHTVDGFGPAIPTTKALIQNRGQDNLPRIKHQLMWKDNHTFTKADIPEIVRRAARLNKLIVQYPKIEWRVSPCLEHNDKGVAQEALKAIRPVLDKRVLLVNAPLTSANYIPGYITELHHVHMKLIPGARMDFSFDGRDMCDADVQGFIDKYYNKVDTFDFWTPNFNGKTEEDDTTPRADRKAFPSDKLIDSLIYYKNGKGDCSLPAHYLMKTHAEQTQAVGDTRANELLFIIPIKTDAVELVADNGQVVERIPYTKPYLKEKDKPQRYVYRSNSWGFEIAEKAKRIQNGKMIVRVRVAGRFRGRVNPAFRQGEYRTKP